jgi:hypothetical protein
MTIETEKGMAFRIADTRPEICETCGSKVPMATVGGAAGLASITSDRVVQMIESGRVHFRKKPSGVLLVCLNSLLKLKEEGSCQE